jgi:hypothetical protein
MLSLKNFPEIYGHHQLMVNLGRQDGFMKEQEDNTKTPDYGKGLRKRNKKHSTLKTPRVNFLQKKNLQNLLTLGMRFIQKIN